MMKLLTKQRLFYVFVAIISVILLMIDLTKLLPTLPLSNDKPSYFVGKVEEVIKQDKKTLNGREYFFQDVRVSFADKIEQNRVIRHGGDRILTKAQMLNKGQSVIIAKYSLSSQPPYYVIMDSYRLHSLVIIAAIFFTLVFIITGKRGLGALLGLGFSLLVIMKFIIPLILLGFNSLLVSILGSILILIVSIYLAHGLKEETTIAVISTGLSLIITGILAVLFVSLAQMSGLGDEDVYSLNTQFQNVINFQGLLLGGIIIGTLGVLDDITTAQTATVYELAHANQQLSVKAIISKGLRVGKEHITSVVNTLVLAYAGASMGVFIFVTLGIQNNSTPLWIILNNEMLAEEVIRTLAGSIGLILAVPLTTVLAAIYARYSVKIV
jgi:uncharacterized membrane protein